MFHMPYVFRVASIFMLCSQKGLQWTQHFLTSQMVSHNIYTQVTKVFLGQMVGFIPNPINGTAESRALQLGGSRPSSLSHPTSLHPGFASFAQAVVGIMET